MTFKTDGGIEWERNGVDKVLTVRPSDNPEEWYATGQMKNYSFSSPAPWMPIEKGWKLVLDEGITNVGDFAFYDCGFIGEIVIPKSVGQIGRSAFSYCAGFTGTLIIPKNVESVGDQAFLKCLGFSKLIIEEGLQTIGKSAFGLCKGLSDYLEIPESTVSIGESAFIGCDGINVLIIGSNVRTIGSTAFYTCRFGSVLFLGDRPIMLPDSGIFSFGIGDEHVSSYCGSPGNWAKTVIPQVSNELTVWNFGDLTVDGGVYWIKDEIHKILIVGPALNPEQGYASGQMKDYSERSPAPWGKIPGEGWDLVLKNGITRIGKESFRNCDGFTKTLILPETVVSIGMRAFFCSDGFVGNLVIPKSVSVIEDEAFEVCFNLSDKLIFMGDVETIGNYVFQDLFRIKTVIFNGSVGTLGKGSFILGTSEHFATTHCYSHNNWAQSVIPGVSDEYTEWHFNDISNIDGGIEWVKDDTSKTLTIRQTFAPEDGYVSGQMKDYDNTGGPWGRITDPDWTLVIEDGVTNIGSYSFNSCTGFGGNIVLPDSVKSVGTGAFMTCTGFDGTLQFSGYMESIGDNSFSSCLNLTKLVFSGSLKSIGHHAFNCCYGVNNILFSGNMPDIIGGMSFALGDPEHQVECTCNSPGDWARYAIPSASDGNTVWHFNGQPGNTVFVRVNGEWKRGNALTKVNGEWR